MDLLCLEEGLGRHLVLQISYLPSVTLHLVLINIPCLLPGLDFALLSFGDFARLLLWSYKGFCARPAL